MPKIDDVFERTIRLDERVSNIDKKIDHLIAAVSAAPAAAGHPPPPADSAETGKKPLPKNLSEWAGFAIDKLGGWGPPVLFVVIVIVAFLGIKEVFSTINERDESVRSQVIKTAIATMDAGLNVVKSTNELIKLNEKLGVTGKKLLELQLEAAVQAKNADTEKRNAEQAVQKADDEAAKAVTERLKAEQAVRKAQELSVSLTIKGQKLIKAIASLETEQASLVEKRLEIEFAKANIEFAKANLAQREGDLADKDVELSETRATINSLQKELKRLRGKGQNEKTRSRKELTELRAKFEKLQALQTFSQYQIAGLEKQSQDLIVSLQTARTTIQKLGDATASLPEVPKLKESPPEPAQPKKPPHIDVVAETLRKYAKNPDAVTSEEWERLFFEDVTPAELDSLLEKDLGFKLVLKVNAVEEDDDDEEVLTVYVPVQRMTSDQVIGVLFLFVEDDNELEAEFLATSLTFVRLRNLTDFNRTRVAVILDFFEFDESNEIGTLLYFQSDKIALTFSDILRELFVREFELTVKSIGVHYGGTEPVVRILGMADAAAKFPDLVKRWISEEERVAVANEMENRANGFDADQLIPAAPFDTETTLRTALVRLIGAAVSGNTPAASPLLTKPLTVDDLGRLAAIALRGELVFDKPPDVQEAQTKAAGGTAADYPQVPAASATVFASIRQPKLGPYPEDVEFRFRRDSGNPQWKLIGFGAAAKSRK